MKFFYAVFSLMFFVSNAIAQDRGTIDCMGLAQVPAWTAPGSAYVMEYLVCGQLVSITGLERGYVQIQIGNRVGYVDAKYVRLPQTQAQKTKVQPPEPVPVPAATRPQADRPQRPNGYAEETRFSVTGMFTWVRAIDDGSAEYLFGSEDYLGWDFTFAGNATKHFGLEIGVSGNYWLSPTNMLGAHYHSIAGGPRFTFPGEQVTPYIHVLVGLARGTGRIVDFTGSINALMLAGGVGLDVKINRHLGVKAFQVEWIPMHTSLGGWSLTNMRLGGGIVARF